MKGLLWKDLTSLCRPVNFIVVSAVLIAGISLKSLYLLTAIPLFLGSLPVAWMQEDENSRWHIRQMTLPYARGTIVAEKYLLSLLLALSAALLTCCGMLFSAQNRFPDFASAAAWLTGACMPCIVLPALMLPFCFRFGAAKSRLLVLFLIIAFGGLHSAAISFPDPEFTPFYYTIIAVIRLFPSVRENREAVAFFNRMISAEKSTVILLTLAGYALLTAVSWLLSLPGFRRREF